MKKIWTIFRRDLKSSFRDSMVLYILVMPFLIAIILNLLTASTSGTALNVVVDPSVDTEVVEYLKTVGSVETVTDSDALIERVNRLDDIYGVSMENGDYLIHRQGNEKVEMQQVLQMALDTRDHSELLTGVEVTVSDVGWILSPVKRFGGNILAVFVTVFGAMVLMIHLVEEKQENTLAAMNVAPVERAEYVAGKSILGFLLPVIHVLGILLILNYGPIDYVKAAVVILALALTSVIVGFAIGIRTDNVIGAISGMKMMFVPILASVFGAIYLKESLHFLLYWSPFYWAFRAMDRIILQTATWQAVLLPTGIILLISTVVMLLMAKRIRQGLK